MANLHRGEIEAVLDGQPMVLCLTLGALAELEAVFGEEDMLALANRLSSGRLSARFAEPAPTSSMPTWLASGPTVARRGLSRWSRGFSLPRSGRAKARRPGAMQAT
jgi:hypothetical protein